MEKVAGNSTIPFLVGRNSMVVEVASDNTRDIWAILSKVHSKVLISLPFNSSRHF